MDYSLLVKLVPPAIIVSVLAYLTRFFGKAISDQVPFADDRKWHIEITGVMFMLNLTTGGLIGIALANTWAWEIGAWTHFITFAVLSLFGGSLFFNNKFKSAIAYNIEKIELSRIDEKSDGFFSWYSKLADYTGVAILPIILSYFATIEYHTDNIYFFIAACAFLWQILMWSALNFSLRKMREITPVEIHFIDKNRESLKGVQVLKVNEDNIRVRIENKILILNKNEVVSIEMPIPGKYL